MNGPECPMARNSTELVQQQGSREDHIILLKLRGFKITLDLDGVRDGSDHHPALSCTVVSIFLQLY